MYFSTNSSIDDYLTRVTHVFAYLQTTPEAQSALDQFGYTADRLQEGKLLLEQVKTAHNAIQQQQAKQKDTTDRLHEAWKQAQHHYRLHLFAARRVLGRGGQSFLNAKATTYAQELAQANTFYKAMLESFSYQEKLATLNIHVPELFQASQLIEQLVASKTLQTQSLGLVRSATQTRNQQYSELKRWFKTLLSVARIAFGQQPALLTALRTLTARPKREAKLAQTTAPQI